MKINRTISTISILAALVFMPAALTSAGQANETATEETKPQMASSGFKLDAVKVTARKRKEKVQEVPVSVSVINETDIEDRKIESIYDVADFAPGLMIPNNGASGTNTPFMRGVGADHGYNVPAGLYIDGVPKLTTFGYDEAFLDIERVEVLRGPQGTLYGKNNEAGVINIITRQPDNEFRSKAALELGEDQKRQLSALVSGPILEDKLYFGLTGLFYQKDGFIDNTFLSRTADDREHWFGKVHLRFTPIDPLEISLIASRMQYNDGALRQNLTSQGAAGYGLPTPPDRQVTSNLKGANDSTNDSQSLKVVYDINDSLTLTSVTARSNFDSQYTNDLDYSSFTYFHMFDHANYSGVSQELRLDSSNKAFKWLVGLYYGQEKEETDYTTESIIPGFAGVTRRDIDGTSYSAFAHASYPIWKKLSVSAGIRYDKEKKDFKDYVLGTQMDGDWSEISPKLALEYKITPDIMTYISASKGYRAGGFNPLTTDDSPYKTYEAEKLWSYEIGAKTAFCNNRLIINSSVYYMSITDMQVQEAVSPRETFLTNAAEATGKGFELELLARPFKGLDIRGAFAYNPVEFDKFSDASGNYEGNQNPFAPEYSYGIGIQYRDVKGYYGRVDLIGYAKMYLDKANQYTRPSYNLVHTKIGYETKHFDIYVYARNLFDEQYDSVGYFGGNYVIYSEPREIGIRLVGRF